MADVQMYRFNGSAWEEVNPVPAPHEHTEYAALNHWHTQLKVYAGNEVNWAHEFGGGTLYLNYRGVGGSGISNYRFCNGQGEGLTPISVLKTIYNDRLELFDAGDRSLRIANTYGYVDIGPKDGTTCHIYTDRPNFYMNKHLLINGTEVATRGANEYNGTNVFVSNNATPPYNRPIEIREVAKVGANQSSDSYAPAIAFHWVGRNIKNLLMDSSGNLKFGSNKIYDQGNLSFTVSGDTLYISVS